MARAPRKPGFRPLFGLTKGSKQVANAAIAAGLQSTRRGQKARMFLGLSASDRAEMAREIGAYIARHRGR